MPGGRENQAGSDPGDSEEDEGDKDAAAALAVSWDAARPG